MPIRYRLSEDDYVAAQRLLLRRGLRRRGVPLGVGLLLVVAGLAVLTGPLTGVVLLAGLPLILLAVWSWRLPRAWRRLYRRVPSEQREVTLDFSPDGLTIDTPASHATVRWSAYSRYSENAELIVLFQPNRLGIPLPKRAFTVEELARFRDLLAAHVSAGATAIAR